MSALEIACWDIVGKAAGTLEGGILSVSATDEATGKAQKVTITSNSCLNEDEIQRMVDMGLLTDENGRKLSDLTGVKWWLEGNTDQDLAAVEHGKLEAHGWYFIPVYEDAVVLKLEGNAGQEIPFVKSWLPGVT